MKILAAIILFALAVTGTYFVSQKTNGVDLARPTIMDEVQPGCILVSPFPQLLAHNFVADLRPRIFLVNKKTKKVVRQWSASFPFFSSKIVNDGSLWGLTHKRWDGGSPAEIVQLNEKSEVTAQIKLPDIGEDFDSNPSSGSIFLIQSYRINYARSGGTLVYDKIIEVEPKSLKVIWSWDTKDLNFSEKNLNSQQVFRGEVMHTNAVRYLKTNPINQKPAILISARNISTVALVDYETKQILWKSHPDMFEFQHDPTLLENGDLLVFNNRRFESSSTIDQINMKSNNLVWQYRSATEQDFQASVLGSAQRLENGNTLIVEGPRGHLFEINSKKDIVWEYFSTFEISKRQSPWPISPLFRVEQYSSDFIEKLGWGKICE